MPSSLTSFRLISPRRWAAGAGLALILLAGCGGGSSQVDPFVPERLITFGDESGLLIKDAPLVGRRYGINGLDTDGRFDCRQNAVWPQWLASELGMLFAECPYTGSDDLYDDAGVPKPPKATVFKATQRAQVDAGAEALAAQVQAQIDAGGMGSTDMAAVMVGTKDIIDVYEALVRGEYASTSAAANELKRRGGLVAAQVNRLVGLGAKVLVSTVPRMDVSPYGLAKEAAQAGQGRVLKDLSDAFNAELRFAIIQDGTKIGLILADDAVLAMARNPNSFGLVDDGAKKAACKTTRTDGSPLPVQECTVDTLIDGAKTRSNLWADDRRMGPVGHRQIGLQFASRAKTNPF